MKITETTTRECCQGRDLQEIIGPGKPCGRHWYFCRHCGRQHVDMGGSEPESPGVQPMPWPWEDELSLFTARQIIQTTSSKANGDYWVWQNGTGENCLESIVLESIVCPVLIDPKELLRLIRK